MRLKNTFPMEKFSFFCGKKVNNSNDKYKHGYRFSRSEPEKKMAKEISISLEKRSRIDETQDVKRKLYVFSIKRNSLSCVFCPLNGKTIYTSGGIVRSAFVDENIISLKPLWHVVVGFFSSASTSLEIVAAVGHGMLFSSRNCRMAYSIN